SPTVNANVDQSVCANNATVTLAGSVTIATGGVWTTGGSGTFADSSVLGTTYSPSPADKVAGSVVLTLTTTGNGNCNPVSDLMLVTISVAPTANAGLDQIKCANNTVTSLSGSVTVATGGVWGTSGSGTFNDSSLLAAVYTPSAADTATGSITLTLTTTGNGNCLAVSDAMILTITDAPTVNAGVDQTLCANNSVTTLAGSVTVATGGLWTTGGSGSFDNPTLTGAAYTPSPADKAAGTVTLTLTSTGNGSCIAVADFMVLTITPAPTVDAGLNDTVCADTSGYTLSGTVTVASGGVWTTGGTGSFNDSALLAAKYTPSAADTAARSVTLTLTSTGNGLCIAVVDSMLLAITPASSVNAGTDQTVCANNAVVTLAGSVINASGGVWTKSGTGAFADSSVLTTTYTPSAADTAAGTVTLTLTTTGNGQCKPVSDFMVVTITDAPTANAASDQTVCANAPNVTLSGSVTVAAGGNWTTSGSGSFTPASTTLGATYNPSFADTAAGSVTLTLTTTGNGLCSAVSDAMIVTINPGIYVNAGTDQTVCANNPNVSLAGAVWGGTATGRWTTGGSGTFNDSSLMAAVYSPSAADTTAGSVTLTLTSTGNGACAAVTDIMVVTISSGIYVSAGTDQTVCANNAATTIAGAVWGGTTTGVWTTGGSGAFTPTPFTLGATYTPSPADIAGGTVTLTLTSTGNGSCIAVADFMVL
ncbi:MAG: gliding motility-associated C-terminal domain-containing protein, partial [Elusimicrobiota bacterium]